jgi:hypothetical protein
MDRSFAYHPQKRFFWKREVKKIQVRSDEGCNTDTVYSPAGKDTPSRLSLCREYSLGHSVAVADGAAFVGITPQPSKTAGSIHAGQEWSQPQGGEAGQGSTIVVYKNDRLSWAGTKCAAKKGGKLVTKEAEIFTCVKQTCPHPGCCDCGNPYCSAGVNKQACSRHMPPRFASDFAKLNV